MSTTHRTRTARIGAALAILLAGSLVLAGCGAGSTQSGRESAGSVAVQPGVATPDQAPPAGGTTSQDSLAVPGKSSDVAAPGQTKLVVVNKTLRLETADVQAALSKISDLAKKAGGDIANMQVSTSNDQPIYRPMPADQTGASTAQGGPLQAYVTVRVPAKTYAEFVDAASKLGRVLFQSESSDDVTQQHVDMQARLGNLQAEVARLREMFAKARNVREMLDVEQELARVQGEVESLQAQIKYLERQAAMATVTIELAEPKPIVRPAGTDWGVGTALTDSIRAFVNTLNVLIVILGPVLALLVFVALPVVLVVWLIVRSARRRSLRRAAAAAVAEDDETPAGEGDAS